MNKRKVGMCKHFHFLTGGVLFLQFFAEMYKMKTLWRVRIFAYFLYEAIQLYFN